MWLSTGNWKLDLILFAVATIIILAYGRHLDRKERKP